MGRVNEELEQSRADFDNRAVDRFAERMKEKLAKARARGKRGWTLSSWLEQDISDQLRAHVEKGDPVDVANYCMFLSERGESIQPAIKE
jgi:hypothetical protein